MSRDATSSLDIAVVGLAGRFPGAPSIEGFWRNLRAGVESVRDLSEDELRAAGADDAWLADPALVRRAAPLPDIDRFDAELFRFTPREAELTDPQFRALLEDAWAALEDAGHLSDAAGARIGVFAGAGASSYFENHVARNAAARAAGAQASLGNAHDYLATQLSYRLDLRGPAVTVQTACSTSLVAVHYACQSLLSHECDVAIAGGVSISVPQTTGYVHEEGDIASPDGRCRAFDAGAAGCIKGNACAVVVLRRLHDALRDGDTIRAVIRGSAVNNDGNAKVGFTAPSVEGQAGVIAEALAAAGVDPDTISYVEAHGTATALGDPVEVAALTRAFGGARAAGPRCALGSLKTNVGHLDAAAGVAGLVKTVLLLQHGELVPSLHFRTPNPRIDFASSPFWVNTELRPWSANGGPRRAGVSSFGIGGTNAHVIVEEAPGTPAPRPGGAKHVLMISAAGEAALHAACANLANHLEVHRPNLADVAFTLHAGRKRLPWRRCVVAAGIDDAAARLRATGAGAATSRRDERRAASVAFLFPGQGAQRAGMVRTLWSEETRFREAFDACADVLRPLLGLDLRDLVLVAPEDATANERLRDTALAQPALFAVERSLAELLAAWGVHPAAMAGHSLGEYVAAQLAGVLSLEDALALVAERGRLMGSMPRGAMVAVPLSEDATLARLGDHPRLALAVVSGPASCVAAGGEADIARFEAELAREGIACRRLHTSHAFHSPMMDPILDAFEARVRQVRLSAPRIPFLSNLTGTWITAEQATDARYWADHLRRTVRFADNLAALTADPTRVLLEVGPGTTIASAARAVRADAEVIPALAAAGAGGDEARALLAAAGRLWISGADLDPAGLHGEGRRRIPLPTYPFQRERYWIEPDGGEALPVGGSGTETKNPDLAAWFWLPGWRRSVFRAERDTGHSPWLVLDDGSPLAHQVVLIGEERGAKVVRVRLGAGEADDAGDDPFLLEPARRDLWEALLRELAQRGAFPGRIVHLWCAEPGGRSAEMQDLGFHALVALVQALGHVGATEGLRVVAAANGLHDVTGESPAGPERATIAGLCRVAPQEYPGACFRLVDATGADAAECARRIVRELDADDREPVVAWRGGHRWVPVGLPVRVEAPPSVPAAIRPGGVHVLTGGAGELERALAARLVTAGAKGIVFLASDGAPAADLAELAASGAEVLSLAARVENGDDLAAAIRTVRDRFGRLDVVFHTAGEIGGGMIQLMERAAAERVLAPRLAAGVLADLLREDETLVCFSSAISAAGVFGQADYCAASSYLDALAAACARRRGGPKVLTLDFGMAFWDRWASASGAAAESLADELRAIRDAVGITVEEGVEAAWRALALGEPQVFVSTQDLEELAAQSRAASMTDVLEGLSAAAPGSASVASGAGGLTTDTERSVAAVWTELLGVREIGREDGFFELGGNSLLAIQLASRLRKRFEIDLGIASLFESANLAALAAAVDLALEERRTAHEVARLLDEIEGLSDEEIREELARGADAGAGE
jgi:acyl transferase domain-containing protein